MKKTLIVSGALAAILSLTPHLQAEQFSFRMSAVIPALINSAPEDATENSELRTTQNMPIQVTVQQFYNNGQILIIKTAVLM